MIWIHIKGNVAEYTAAERGASGQYFDLTTRLSGDGVWFSNQEYCEDGVEFPNWHRTKEEAIQAAMDYHETEGCKAYLELYPAPDKGQWSWIFQDANGEWYGCEHQPVLRNNHWWVANKDKNDHLFLKISPPNPFWRKTLR